MEKGLIFGSVCSGIEAASVAWEPLGWKCSFVSEIEGFPSAVLKERYPDVPNFGDFTKITYEKVRDEGRYPTIDVLIGGTPCQSFSVAGLRKGLESENGNLALEFVRLLGRLRPRWFVWENVPGVLTSGGGGDFASILGGFTGRDVVAPGGKWKNSGCIEGIGSAYGVAWRVLDAQYFGVAQRRRRVFVIGYLGDWKPAAAVLFESDSLSRDSKKGGKKGKETSSDVEGSLGEAGDVSCAGGNISPCVTSKWKNGYGGPSGSNETGNMVYEQVAQPQYFESHPNDSRITGPHDVGNTVSARYCTGGGNTPIVGQPYRKVRRAKSDADFETWDEKTNTLNNFDTGDVRSTNIVAQPIQICFNDANGTRKDRPNGGCYITENPQLSPTVTQAESDLKVIHPVTQPITMSDVAGPLDANYHKGAGSRQGGEREYVAQPIAFTTEQTPKYNENQALTLTKSESKHNQCVAQPIAFDTYNQTINDKTTQTLGSAASDVNHYGAVLLPTVIDKAAFNQGENAKYTPQIEQTETMPSLVSKGPHAVQPVSPTITQCKGSRGGCSDEAVEEIKVIQQVQHTMSIRRLTPVECERLQGFPNNWTRIPYKGKTEDNCPDGPRYKACGNSMATPVIQWLGKRIEFIESLL